MSDTTKKEYFEIINSCAKKKTDLMIPNGNALHAAYLFKTFFKFSQNKICIFTGRLYSEVFDNEEVIENAKKFLREGGDRSIEIAIQGQEEEIEDIVENRKFISTIINDQERKGSLRVYDSRGLPRKIKTINHFATMDDRAFRFETDHKESKAFANFGDKEKTSILIETFNTISNLSKEVLSEGIK